jgi:predicted  nucleic acid-binding Zn-ribbon protein
MDAGFGALHEAVRALDRSNHVEQQRRYIQQIRHGLRKLHQSITELEGELRAQEAQFIALAPNRVAAETEFQKHVATINLLKGFHHHVEKKVVRAERMLGAS